MKKKISLTMLALVGAFAATSVVAQERGERLNFETLDADGSGEITQEDLEALRDNRFAEIDANGDGAVTEAEFVAHAESRAADRAGQMFARLDADGDGELSRDVLESRGERGGRRLERMLSRVDTDDSGGISEAEFDAAKERFAGRGGKRDGKRSNR